MAQVSDFVHVAEPFSVKGPVALVTGGGSGIGLMITRALVDAGAKRVYILGQRMTVLLGAANSVDRTLRLVKPVFCDATSKSSFDSVANYVERDIGYLNLIVCTAATVGTWTPAPGQMTVGLWRQAQMLRFEDFTTTFRLNSSAVWFTATASLKLLDEGNRKRSLEGMSSQVVMVSATAGFDVHATGGGYAYGPRMAAATHIAKGVEHRVADMGDPSELYLSWAIPG
ncbi:3-oxoacyl-acyl-carrier reductase [Achaetomium macrosporum]|uniref:3-oxoacyl-acyl-carrier reductase n=1 Tax=Achaetomium macrosporum TaxID=79813 RepID=A0AAN7CJI8_9PEZI|nr:3-oxoacyl-acyl-carrier reductase [Achaetomium macrosporum]